MTAALCRLCLRTGLSEKAICIICKVQLPKVLLTSLCAVFKKSLITVEKQTEDVKDGYVVKDNIEYAFDNQIPLWMFGFLY